MPADPRKLKPSELCRLLNSTPLGEGIRERQLYRHRQRAGARIGDNKTVELIRYCAWMHVVRHTPKPTSGIDPYESMKERARARNAALALAGRDIGELPTIGAIVSLVVRLRRQYRAQFFRVQTSLLHEDLIALVFTRFGTNRKRLFFPVNLKRRIGIETLLSILCVTVSIRG